MMKYTNPEMKINMFELESVATQASSTTPDNEGLVSGLEGIDAANRAKVNLSEMSKVTKFVY